MVGTEGVKTKMEEIVGYDLARDEEVFTESFVRILGFVESEM